MMHSLTKENCRTVPNDTQCSEKFTESLLEQSKDVTSGKHLNFENSLEQNQPSTLEVAAVSVKSSPMTEQTNTSVSHLGLETNIMGDVSMHSGSTVISFAPGPCEMQSEGVLAELEVGKTLQNSQSSASNLC
jgi:1-phosphatidylinositol-3-phosphate 5-kinase